MRDILFVLLSMFVAGNILTEWRNRKALPWMSNPMSAYLAGVPWAWVQDIGFVALAGALVLFSIGPLIPQILFLLGAVSLLMVVLTKYIASLSKFHKTSAALAFTSVIAGILVRTWHTGNIANSFAMASICVAFLFMRFAPKKTELEEKSVATCIVIALYALGAAL